MGFTHDRPSEPGPHSMGPVASVQPGGATIILISGLVPWNSLQPDRRWIIPISFVSALAACALCWGSLMGWGFLGFAFLTHCFAVLDVVRQRAFPVFHPGVAVAAICTSLGMVIYVPLAGMLWEYAFPAMSRAAGAGYLVNFRAYQANDPTPGDWVWMCGGEANGGGCAGKVLAVAGQEVEWTGRQWRVDGRNLVVSHPGSLPYYPANWRFRIPRHHLLIDQDAPTVLAGNALMPLAIVDKDRVAGRAWARYSPFWDRCLL